MSGGDPEAGLRLAGALVLFFQVSSYGQDHQTILEETLRRTEPRPSAHRAWALMKAGFSVRQPGRRDEAVSYLEQSVAMYRQIADTWGTGSALQNLGQVLGHFGEWDRARATVEEALPLLRAQENLSEYGWGLWTYYGVRTRLGWDRREAQGRAEASALLEETLAVFTKESNPYGRGYVFAEQVRMARAAGDTTAAQSLFTRARACFDEAGSLSLRLLARSELASLAAQAGDAEGARAHVAERLDLLTDGDTELADQIATNAGFILVAVGDHAARPLFEETLVRARQRQDDWRVAQAEYGLGYVALAEGDRAEAGGQVPGVHGDCEGPRPPNGDHPGAVGVGGGGRVRRPRPRRTPAGSVGTPERRHGPRVRRCTRRILYRVYARDRGVPRGPASGRLRGGLGGGAGDDAGAGL